MSMLFYKLLFVPNRSVCGEPCLRPVATATQTGRSPSECIAATIVIARISIFRRLRELPISLTKLG